MYIYIYIVTTHARTGMGSICSSICNPPTLTHIYRNHLSPVAVFVQVPVAQGLQDPQREIDGGDGKRIVIVLHLRPRVDLDGELGRCWLIGLAWRERGENKRERKKERERETERETSVQTRTE
jgi:hypothetical protein